METVLILGARAPVALELARSFAAAGHRVVAADSLRWTIARWSNAVARYVTLPPPRYAPGDFARELEAAVRREGVTHLIPTCEEAFYVALYRDRFPCKVWVSDISVMHYLHNKHSFAGMAQQWLRVPETVSVRQFTTWDDSAGFVFKPVYSRFATATIIGKKLTPAHFPEPDRWIAQRFVKGRELCVYSVWNRGILKAFACYHPLYRAGKGAGIFFEPQQHDLIYRQVAAFGHDLGYTGQLSFDVIVDETGQPFFIECNPRATSGAHLLGDQLAAAFLADGPVVTPGDQEYAIGYAMALLHPAALFRRRILQARDVIFRRNDPLPALLQPLSLVEITALKFRKNISWLSATTGDIEWNGNEQD